MKYLAVVLMFLFFSCVGKGKETNIETGSKETYIETASDVNVRINTPTERGTIGSIDIPSPGFFWMLRSWKDGTLLTMDSKAQFAEISFVGSGMRITPLVDFPNQRIDRSLIAAPESETCVTQSGGMFHVADIAAKKTKTLMLFRNWRYSEGMVKLLDAASGIICLSYFLRSSVRGTPEAEGYGRRHSIIYDIKNDTVLYESPVGGDSFSMNFGFTQDLVLCQNFIDNDASEVILYNWKTQEIIRNELTEKMTSLRSSTLFDPGSVFNVTDRYMLGRARGMGNIKMTWDENYEDVQVIPLGYLFPSGKRADDFYFSADYKWATAFIRSYEDSYGNFLYKRAFFHLDGRYPNGISLAVFADGYYGSTFGGLGAFVEHPEHGLCYAEERYRKEGGGDKLYLRLHKMDDVLTEINRQLLEQ